MSYKALITDLDGTAVRLASDGNDVDDEARQAVLKAQKLESKIACATGRRWSYAKPVIKKLGITSACVVEAGTRIVDPKTGKTIWEKALDGQALAATLDIFKREAPQCKLSTLNLHSEPLSNVSQVADDARFMYLLSVPPEAAAAICNTVNAQGFAVAHPTPSWFGQGNLDVHVTHTLATKEHAIKVWQQIEGLPQPQTICLGDSGNDVPLFQAAGLKVAVGNATPELKKLADYIAPPQNKDALTHVINKFLLRQN